MPIKCEECGFVAKQRLTWQHFRTKCTGRFNMAKEYLEAYPGKSLMTDDLRKRTAATLDNLVNKYGIEEGEKR